MLLEQDLIDAGRLNFANKETRKLSTIDTIRATIMRLKPNKYLTTIYRIYRIAFT